MIVYNAELTVKLFYHVGPELSSTTAPLMHDWWWCCFMQLWRGPILRINRKIAKIS